MRFVKAKYEIWKPKECNAKTIIESIERAAKVCYKSEVNIKEGSALPFVKGLIKRGHTSCLEHGSVYLKIDYEKLSTTNSEDIHSCENFIHFCINAVDDNITYHSGKIDGVFMRDTRYNGYGKRLREVYLYTNARYIYEKCPKLFWDIILERPLPEFISLFTPKENDPYRRQTIFFTSDQRITEEFIRHRIASPNKESTRYCCYSSDKHNSQLTFIIPPKFYTSINDGDIVVEHYPEGDEAKVCYSIGGKWCVDEELCKLLNYYSYAENIYKEFTINCNWRAEEARITLPLGTKADLVLTNSLIDWCYGRPEPVDYYVPNIEDGEVEGKRIKGFFGLRCDSAAHPQARELAIPLMEDFKRNGWIEE